MFSYDPAQLSEADAAGRKNLVRLLIGDTQNTAEAPAIFEDEELTAFLHLTSQNVYEAAALAFETWARESSKIARKMERDGLVEERFAVAELLAAADRIRTAGIRGDGTLSTGSIVSSNFEYLEEYRPNWRELTDPPVVE